MRRSFTISGILFFLFSFSLWGQQEPTTAPENLKIGVVLSGGGAKGLAHIGALKVMEEAGIQIDFIGGSSMGAIVGGLYAAGYSAEQLDSIFSVTNFSTLIQDDLPRRAKDYKTKEGSQRYALTLPFDNFKLSFPSGLSRGQNVYNMLAQLTYPVREIKDFSQLPIPFFCIGTDIESGERLVLDHGSLPKSILASGAIPSLFKPVNIDGKLVSDGGITDNYPVEEMRKRGADYIIGVDVQDSLAGRKNLKTVFEILTQVNNFRTIRAMRTKRGRTDLYIKPDIKEFSILSFDRGQEIIRSGEEAAQAFKEDLVKLAQRQQVRSPQKTRPVPPDSLQIRSIEINGIENYKRSYVRGKIRVPTSGKISYQSLNNGLDNLSATDNYDWIGYQLNPMGEEVDELELNVVESQSKTKLRFGLHYDQLYKSAALVNLTHKNFLSKNDHVSMDVIIGDNFRYRFDYFIDKGNYWSFGMRSRLTQFKDNVDFGFLAEDFFDEAQRINKIQLDYTDLTNQIYLETLFLRSIRFGIGFEHKYTKLRTETILLEGEQAGNYTVLERSHGFGPFGYMEYDGYDNRYFPSRGIYFRGDFNSYLFALNETFDFKQNAILKGNVGYAFSPFQRLDFRMSASMGVQMGHSDMKALDFSLGGYGNNYVNNIEPFFGYDFNSAIGNSFIKALAQLDYHLFPKHHLMLGYNIANIGDNLFKDGKIFEAPEFSGTSIGYGVETFLGPLELYYSFSPEKVSRGQWFVSLGFWF